MFNVTTFGATGNGTTDDRASIQLAIDAAKAAGGGIVYFPKGTYLLNSVHPTVSGQILVVDGNNIFLEGEGRGVSILKVGNNLHYSAVDFENMVGGGISKLEINGNRANNNTGHGVRGGGNLTGWTCKDMYIHHSGGYGIGLQVGSFKDCLISDVIIEDTGQDGIDIKNSSNGNTVNRMDNVIVKRSGLRSDVSTQACIDLRGVWLLNNIVCTEFSGNCTTGIRFRFGESSDPTGVGAFYSSLSNFYVKANSTGGTIGIDINASDCQVGIGHVENCGTGYYILQQENITLGCRAKNCVDGFMYVDGNLPTDANRCITIGSIARSNSGHGFYTETDNVQLYAVIARANNVKGIKIHANSNQTIVSGESQSNSGGNFLNSGTNTVNIDSVGWGT